MDREQRLTVAAASYLRLLETDAPPSIPAFLAASEPELRGELAAALEALLAEGEPLVASLSAPERDAAERIERAARQRALGRLAPAPRRTLAEARKARRMTVAALAAQLGLPVDLLARIERGGVLPATIPARLVTMLAQVLGEVEDAARSLLFAPAAAGAVRLHAKSGAAPAAEQAVPFPEALRQSAATPAQRAAWAEEP